MDPSTFVPVLRALIERTQSDWKKSQQATRRRFNEEVPRAIAEHHIYVSRWCQEAHSASLAGLAPSAPTIDLRFQSVPRRLGVGGSELDELDVLVRPSHVAVLGDLGAGKTTTLRRLASYVAHDVPVPNDDWQFVLLVVCRDERWDSGDLYDVLGKKLGVTGRLRAELDNPESRIREVLDSGALVIVDGLDEVPQRYRGDLDTSLTQLGRHLRRAKIIVSCRSADYAAPLEGFELAEIRPLDRSQIRRLVEHLLGGDESAAFYEAVEGHAAADLANRPLFLTYMAAIFRRRGAIPDRPVDLYESITRLALQEWDEQRRVRRVSKWGEFGVDDKRRFLADLAYELTRRELIRFESHDLEVVYQGLAERYALPKAQARMVVRELESHTGLIAEVAEEYEFSHLSLQEYLAADAMVRAPASERGAWWATYPAVAAVAVALSSNANAWFSELVRELPPNIDDVRPIPSFLRRLGQERPRFVRSADFGQDLLKLLSRAHISDAEAVAGLHEMKSVRDSVADAIESFTSVRQRAAMTRLARYDGQARSATEVLEVPTSVLSALLGDERLRQVLAACARDG